MCYPFGTAEGNLQADRIDTLARALIAPSPVDTFPRPCRVMVKVPFTFVA